ncbi:MAG: replicative DNA helicase [Proteobacteria bacterium]|nr:replicative DNA helicase [Pseudomonadota bacterium]
MVEAVQSQYPGTQTAESLRLPPHSVEAEQSILGGLMLDNSGWDRIADLLHGGDFYRRDHQLIFEAIGALSEKSIPSDAVTVSEHLEKCSQLDDAGGLAYIASLARDTPSAANIKAYAEIVRERSMLRELIRVGGEIAGSAHANDGRGATDLVDEAERKVFEIAERGQRAGTGFIGLRKILPGVIDRLDELSHSEGDITGVATGFQKFDALTAGLHGGELIIIAGRPSMGKTTLAMNIAENAAIAGKVPTAIFSMEMSAEQLAFRMIGSIGRVNQSNLRTGRFSDEDWTRINSAVAIMSQAPIFIDDTPALSPTEIRSRARRLKREHGLGLIIVDYLQLMEVAGTRENRATEISEISRSLKALAKELNVPIVALSQLNRGVELRTDKRPVMSDLRESGAIEQDADLIAFIYREEVYDPDTPRKGVADIIIAKQRNGPIGDFHLTFLGEYTRFENLIAEDYGLGDYR